MGHLMREISRPNLSRLTTLRLGGNAVAEFVLEENKDFAALFSKVSSLGLPMLVRKLSVKPEKKFLLKSEADAIYRVFLDFV